MILVSFDIMFSSYNLYFACPC